MLHLLKKFVRRPELTDYNKKEFCQRHRINVIDSSKRAYKHTQMNVQWFKYQDDYNKIDNVPITFETETLYTIEIAETELQRIADFEFQVFNNMKEKGHYGMFETLMEQKEKEKILRDRYPAVKKAYEYYSLMLALANSGDLPDA